MDDGQETGRLLCQCSSSETGCKVRPESVPHFTITTTVEGAMADATDSTELWVRSRWYEAVSRDAATQANLDSRWIDVFMAPWVVPMEFEVAKSAIGKYLAELKPDTMDESWLFLSRNLVADDALFLYELQFSDAPSKTLDAWSQSSLVAKFSRAVLKMAS